MKFFSQSCTNILEILIKNSAPQGKLEVKTFRCFKTQLEENKTTLGNAFIIDLPSGCCDFDSSVHIHIHMSIIFIYLSIYLFIYLRVLLCVYGCVCLCVILYLKLYGSANFQSS